MARFENDARLGYYPTPESMTDKLLQRLRFSGSTRVFDPCAGEGIALQTVQSIAPVGSISYGIELDKARANKAMSRLDHVIASPYEICRVDKASMQLLFLNPPYDNRASKGGDSTRMELSFLRGTAKYVAAGGVLVFIIPRTTLSKQTIGALELRYTDLAVYRFDDDEFQAYKQVVVYGTRREKALTSTKQLTADELESRRHLLAVGSDSLTTIPYLDDADGRTWTVPSGDVESEIEFRGDVRDEAELRRDLALSDGFAVAESMLQGGSVETHIGRPLLPIRRAHYATLIAAGALNGAIGTGDKRHVVIGTSRKLTKTERIYDEQGRETKIESDEWIPIVRTIEPNGMIRDLK